MIKYISRQIDGHKDEEGNKRWRGQIAAVRERSQLRRQK